MNMNGYFYINRYYIQFEYIIQPAKLFILNFQPPLHTNPVILDSKKLQVYYCTAIC